jgi:16S rRNA U516 pseudouridylate synthase RsuA-like enzyme
MTKSKRKLTSAEKAEKKRRRREYMTIFVNGKQKQVKRPPTVEGIPVEEFIRNNADPLWLYQNEMWGFIDQSEDEEKS